MGRTCILGLLLVAGGCGTATLETGAGYKPVPLSASEGERRGYYAAPYSPESRGTDDRRMMFGPSRGAAGGASRGGAGE